MSSPKSIIVNCGATQVSVAVFGNTAGRLILERFVVEDLDYDFAGDDAWLGALTVALSGIVRGLKLSGPASIIIPGYQLLTKTIKVPQVEKDKQSQIIGFEAQKQIPYPLAEVVWDSQIISTDGIEAEVMLFALKLEVANRIAAAVTSTGLTPSVLEASTLLDSQAWRTVSAGDNDEVLVVNIGARTTNLTFINAAGFSVQNVNIGGNLLTQSIADSIAQPFRTAENLKVAYFSGKTHLSESDKHTADMKNQAQDFMRRVSQEITRRIVIYKRQNRNAQPKKIILTGRGAMLPGLSEYLCETQRISVDYFDPFPAFDIGPAVDAAYIESCRLRLSEIVGEAARGTLADAVGVNLLPAAMEEAIAFSRTKPLLVAATALLAIAPWPVYAHFSAAAKAAKVAEAGVSRRLGELRGYQADIAKIRGEAESLSSRHAELHAAVDARDNWRDFLAGLQKNLAAVPDTWIEEMKFVRTAPPAEPAPDPNAPAPADRAAPTKRAPGTAKVTLTFRMLMKNVAPGGTFNAQSFNARRKEVLQAVTASPYVAKVVSGSEKPDFSQPNLPRLTLTLDVNQDKKPL